MNAIAYTPEHYPTISSWWQVRQWAPVPASTLPAVGWLIMDANTPRAYLSFYSDPTSDLAWTEWLVTNPANSPRQSLEAIATATNASVSHAQSLGYVKHLMSACSHPSLSRTFQAMGFAVTDRAMLHHVLTI